MSAAKQLSEESRLELEATRAKIQAELDERWGERR